MKKITKRKGLIPRNFENLIIKPKLLFFTRMNNKDYRNSHFQKNRENLREIYTNGDFVKNLECTLVIILVILPI